MSRKKIMLANARRDAAERGLPKPKMNIAPEPQRKERRRNDAAPAEQTSFVETIPIPEVSDADVMFLMHGNAMNLLPKYEDLSKDEQQCNGLYCDAASNLFFSGGRLSDYGIRPRKGADPRKLYRWLKATLPDFTPSHEHKIGGVGHMLAKWCEPTGKGK